MAGWLRSSRRCRGCPKLGQPVEGGPKIIRYDLDNGQVARVYVLPPPATHGASILSHMRSDDSHLYVTDASSGGILVIDRDTGATRVVLHRHPLTQADPDIVPMINGKPYKSAHGKVATFYLSHLWEFLVSQYVDPAINTPAEFVDFIAQDRLKAQRLVEMYRN